MRHHHLRRPRTAAPLQLVKMPDGTSSAVMHRVPKKSSSTSCAPMLGFKPKSTTSSMTYMGAGTGTTAGITAGIVR